MAGKNGAGGLALGVDGGGSKTQAILVDGAGRVRGVGAAGSSNHFVMGLDVATEHLRAAVEAARDAAGRARPVAAAWVGLAGVDRGHDLAAWAGQLAQLGLAA